MTNSRITESTIEKFAIELLKKQGYQYIYAPDIAPDASTSSATGARAERESYKKDFETIRLSTRYAKTGNRNGIETS